LFLGIIDQAPAAFLIRNRHVGLSLTGISGEDKDRRHSKFVMKNVLSGQRDNSNLGRCQHWLAARNTQEAISTAVPALPS
jgi:hypothetical protein